MHTAWCGVLQTDLNQFPIIFHDQQHVLNDFIPGSETNDQNMWRLFLKKAALNLRLLWLIFQMYHTYF